MEIDYEKIIEGIDDQAIINLMTELGADRYRDENGYIIFPTICHNEDSAEASMKLYFYKDSKIFMCYTEDGPLSIFKFLKTYYETRGIDYDWYEDVYKVVLGCSTYKGSDFTSPQKYKSIKDKYILPQKQVQLPEYSKGVLDCFIKEYPVEWLQDGISKTAMDKFNIRFSISQNKIIIPHYDVNGRLVGIRGRALNPDEVETFGKYMPVKIEQTWYTHPLSLNLYGLNFNKENIKKSRVCYTFEAEKSVLLSEDFSTPNCAVAVCGSSINKYALNILLRECAPAEIILCLDNEEKPGEDKYFDKLYSICDKYKNYCNFSFIYDRDGLTRPKDAPVDRGEAIFRELVKKRVKVR